MEQRRQILLPELLRDDASYMASDELVAHPGTCCEQGERRAWIPTWLHSGITVRDAEIGRIGEVMAVAWPGCDARQAWRAWLRPPGGGREWNPRIDDLEWKGHRAWAQM